MIKNEELKTSPKQRIIICLVALLMIGSTFALYAGIVLNYNSNTESAQIDSEKQARFEELYAEYQEQLDAQAKTLSGLYFDEFSAYRSEIKSFNAASVVELKVKDLKKGTGREIADLEDTDYAAYYIGWLSDETVFDSSFDDNKNPTRLVSPLEGSPYMIQGWLEGIAHNDEVDSDGNIKSTLWEGMRIGGIREITIPAVLAYGDKDQGTIPANSPLKFIVMLIEKPEEIEVSEELESLYSELYGY